MKKWITAAVILVIVGTIVCFSAAAAMRFDFGKLDNGKYETNTYEVKDSFDSISIDASIEKIFFRPSEDGKCQVVCLEEENLKHEVGVADKSLTIKPVDSRDLTDYFGFHTRSTEITVYLPESIYSGLNIETDTGDIDIPADFSFDSIAIDGDTSDVACLASAKERIEIALSTGDLSLTAVTAGSIDVRTTTGKISAESVTCDGDVHIRVDTGKVKLQNLTCRNLSSEGTTGDITLNNVIAADTLSIERDTGDVEFSESDAASIFVETDTGDITGSLLTEKVFITDSDTGKVDVPKSITGGRCEISTYTGDIKIEVLQAADE